MLRHAELAAFAALAVLTGACAKQVGPVGPSIKLHYPDVDPRQPYQPVVGSDVLVGRAFAVTGLFDATCAESRAPLFAKNDDKDYGTDYVSCKAEDAQVALSCAGPCSVAGDRVTPTAEGPLKVTIALTSKHHEYSETRTFVARPADSLRIENCVEGPHLVTPGIAWPTCHLAQPVFVVRALANGTDVGLPVTARAGEREQTGTTLSLDLLVGHAGQAPPGTYDLDLSCHGLTGHAKLVFAPPPPLR